LGRILGNKNLIFDIDRTFKLEKIAKAYDYYQKERRGKVILEMD